MKKRFLQPTLLGRAWNFIRAAEASGRIPRGKCGADIASLMADFVKAERDRQDV